MNKGLAVFDMDGTITKKDTFLRFISFACGRFRYALGLIVLSPFISLYLLRIIPRTSLKQQFFTYFFKGEKEELLQEKGRRFSKDVLPSLCRKNVLDRIEWHKSQGHRVVVLTASSPIWLSDWCEHHGVELIGTTFEVKDGLYTGNIDGFNCVGSRKRDIVREILSKNQYEITYGYGNSKVDLEFLAELENKNYINKHYCPIKVRG